jgi:hypothetical protein
MDSFLTSWRLMRVGREADGSNTKSRRKLLTHLDRNTRGRSPGVPGQTRCPRQATQCRPSSLANCYQALAHRKSSDLIQSKASWPAHLKWRPVHMKIGFKIISRGDSHLEIRIGGLFCGLEVSLTYPARVDRLQKGESGQPGRSYGTGISVSTFRQMLRPYLNVPVV